MEKVTFTSDQLKKIYDISKAGEHVFVAGKNGIGESFLTCAMIFCDDRNNPVIDEDFVCLSFGKERQHDLIYAPFFLNVERRNNVDDQLIIESISDKDGKEIFRNEKFYEFNEIFRENGNNIRRNNNQISGFDPVTKNIFKMTGKPVMLEKNHGVFVTLLGVNEHGNPLVVLVNGGGTLIVEINRYSTLFTEDEKGNVKEVANNRDEDCGDIFKRNKPGREIQ